MKSGAVSALFRSYLVRGGEQLICHLLKVWRFARVDEAEYLVHHIGFHVSDVHPAEFLLFHFVLKHGVEDRGSGWEKQKEKKKKRGVPVRPRKTLCGRGDGWLVWLGISKSLPLSISCFPHS